MKITFEIKDEDKPRIMAAMAGLYAIPMIADETKQGEFVPKYKTEDWMRESMRRWICKQVARWEQKQARGSATYQVDYQLIL